MWTIEYLKEAQKDLKHLDSYNRRVTDYTRHPMLIVKAIEKTAEHPLPPPDGIGKPLGNHAVANLSGLYKIKLRNLGYRVVYGFVRQDEKMKIIVISVRDDELVYKEAERRSKGLIEKFE